MILSTYIRNPMSKKKSCFLEKVITMQIGFKFNSRFPKRSREMFREAQAMTQR